MKAQIFSVGTEILLGNITDTNSKFIGQKLTEYGIDVYKMVTIGDNFDRLYQEMKNAYGKVDYIFVTGGLGPTEDDISKEVAIKVIGKEDQVEIDKKSKERIESYFSNNKKAVKVNLKQAKFPKGAIILDNDKGTAPGCIMGDKTKIILLPGPPREMEYMFENKLSSYLKKDAIIKSKNLRIGLLGEWDMANRIDLSSTNPTISPYFDNEGGFLRITAKAKSEKEADFLLNEKEKEVKNVFGNFGIVLLAAIFTLACLTTCIGLITSGGEYFESLFNQKLSYRKWVLVWTLFSFLMANFGLNKLLEFSVPLLTIIYPVALVLILMGISHDFINYSKESYLFTASLSVLIPLVEVLNNSFGIKLWFVTNLVESLPLYKEGLSWLLPSLFVLVITTVVFKFLYTFKENEKIKERY